MNQLSNPDAIPVNSDHRSYDTAYTAVKRARPSTIARLAARLAVIEHGDARSIALGLVTGLLLCRHDLAAGMRLIEERDGIDDAVIRAEIAQLIEEIVR